MKHTTTVAMTTHPVAESKEAWLEARKELLAEEKEYTRAGDKLAARRSQLIVYQFIRPRLGRGLQELLVLVRSFLWRHSTPQRARRLKDAP